MAPNERESSNLLPLSISFERPIEDEDEEPRLPHKKMKTLFLSNMSKSRRLTSTFFPMIVIFWKSEDRISSKKDISYFFKKLSYPLKYLKM